MAKRRTNGKVGDIFMISLKENQHCFGQIIASDDPSTLLCVLFDFVAEEVPEMKFIISKPILAIADIVRYVIEDGNWPIVGNAEVVIKNLVLPNHIEGLPLRVRSYDGKFLRYATEQDKKELSHKTDYPPLAFEYLARHRFEDGPWDGFYDDILYVNNKHRYVGSRKSFFEKNLSQEAELNQEFKKEIYINNLDNNEYSDNELTEIRIRYALDSNGFGNQEDLIKRHRIEDLLNECLMATNNGDCDGGEIGNGEMIIFCYVIDPKKAVETIKKELEKHGYLEGARIS